MLGLIALLGKLLREFAVWFRQMLQLLGRQMLKPLIRHFPGLADTLEELGKRSLARTLWGERWGAEAFLAPGAEEGVEIGAWAAAEYGVGLLTLGGAVTLVVLAAYTLSVVAPVVLAYRENVARMFNVQREIFTRGGSYPGMSADLRRYWTPGPEEAERLIVLHKLNAAPATSAGTGPHDVDDQSTDDYRSLIDPKAPVSTTTRRGSQAPVSQSLPSYNSGRNYSVQASDRLDEAALQRERIRAIQNGDINGYNNLLQQHGQQIQERKGDPGKSGYYPGRKK